MRFIIRIKIRIRLFFEDNFQVFEKLKKFEALEMIKSLSHEAYDVLEITQSTMK